MASTASTAATSTSTCWVSTILRGSTRLPIGNRSLPVYRDYIDSHYEEGYNEPDKNWANSTFDCAHRVKFDLFRRYGLIAAAGDRHLAEFMPGGEYLKDPETVASWKFGLTTCGLEKG